MSGEQILTCGLLRGRLGHSIRSASCATLLKACLSFGILMFVISPNEARALQVFMCTGGANEQQVGLDTSNPSVTVPLCVSTPPSPEAGETSRDGRRDITPYRPPGYVPPPRPKGWQKLWSGFSEFVVGVEQREGSDQKRIYDYALAMNYPNEAEARAAAEGMCRLRGLFIPALAAYYSTLEDYCRSSTAVLEEPFIRLGVSESGSVNVNQHVNPVRAGNINRQVGDKSYNCSSDSQPIESCLRVLAIFPNGLHPRAEKTGLDHVFPCPDGPGDDRYKVVGVDRKTGIFVPLCGPDLFMQR